MAQKVPYQNGMSLGQGFNTFIQQRRVNEAVIVTDQKPPAPGFTKTYMSEEVETYEKLATTLNISAGAAISGYGASTSVDFAYLNKEEFETNFIHGGHFYARVSIFSEDKSSLTEIKQSSKTAFTMYGVTGEVTQEVKNAVEKLNRLSTIRIVINETSGTSSRGMHIKETLTTDLLAVKTLADAFYAAANSGVHNYIRFALLSPYTSLPDFKDYFQPLDYVEADKRSWELFEDFMDYQTFEKLVKDIPANKYVSGESARSEWEKQRVDNVQIIRAKIATITRDPDDSRTPGTHMNPDTFRADVLKSVKMVTYIAQRQDTPDFNWTEIAQKTLAPGAEKIFEFKAFDFENVLGSTVISFGKKIQGSEHMFICLIGARAGQGYYPDWQEESCFWSFGHSVKDFANQVVTLSRLDAKQYLRVMKGDSNSPDARPMFDFFAVHA
ncbi:hypothetical protein NHQ30_004180 [Ciborinia camelliae]|nr:hypothetical protein NHQ30_004180 [Ciborinia camelliae]